MTSANVRGRYLRYSASATRTSYPSGLTEGPPVHPSEPAYPCCLPALGRFTGCTPHEGLRQLYPLVSGGRASVSSSAEDSPRGLGRTLGKRVGLTPSRVRISYPPLHPGGHPQAVDSTCVRPHRDGRPRRSSTFSAAVQLSVATR